MNLKQKKLPDSITIWQLIKKQRCYLLESLFLIVLKNSFEIPR